MSQEIGLELGAALKANACPFERNRRPRVPQDVDTFAREARRHRARLRPATHSRRGARRISPIRERA